MMDESHIIQPTKNPVNGPNASLAYRYAPPVLLYIPPISAKHREMMKQRTPHNGNTQTAPLPANPYSCPGSKKIPAPTTLLIPKQSTSKKPMARVRPRFCISDCLI